jgi:hypothetical protein
MCVGVRVYVCVSEYLHIYVYVCVYMYACIRMYVYVCIFGSIHIQVPFPEGATASAPSAFFGR